jgi:DNA (cytosine-5)-methyltransferase 1
MVLRKRRIITKPSCVELFTGAGGLMLGLEMAGFHTILANDVHPDPCKTIMRNFPKTPIINQSIINLSGQDLLHHANLKDFVSEEIDLIAGGPPCQGFSNAGMKNPKDPRNTLIGQFIRIVDELKPRFFLMENVTGLKTMYEGKLFERVLNEFENINYQFHWKILHAADYGVPQMRKRLFILGSRDGPPPPFPKPTHFKPSPQQTHFSFGEKNLPYVFCGEALADLPLINQGEIINTYDKEPITEFQKVMRKGTRKLFNQQASRHRQITMDYYALVPPGGTWLDIPKNLRKKKQGIQRWPIHGLSRTITTEPTDFLHPKLNRIPTIRELARIQSFPDRYEFLGQRTTGNKMRRLGYCAQSQQVGNAVPPLLAKAVGQAILKNIKKIDTKRKVK